MTLRLFDTCTRGIRDFAPLDAAEVRIYACGPTVYNYAHIGNLRTYLFEDVLRRVLEFNGYKVRHVVNITDVGHLVSDADTGEDKMEVGARRAGKSAWEIADEYARAFKNDLSLLNVIEPTIWCRATEHIPEQIEMIRAIEAKGFTYRTSDGIYFDTSRLPSYGYLARLDTAGLQAGARVEKGEKRNATDFALWKFSPSDRERQMEWPSPWGVAFPGWHIECSAMSTKYLGLSSTFTAAARIMRRCTTPTRSRRAKLVTARAWPIFGCTAIFCFLKKRKWRSPRASSCAFRL